MKPLHSVTFALLMTFIPAVLATPVIRLNTTGQPPLNTPNQQGFMDEVATEAFRRIGYQLKTVRLPAERGLKNANRGLVDGEMSRIQGLDKRYPNLVRVPEKIMDWEFVVFSDKPIDLEKGWRSLSNKSIAHINGWKIFEKNTPLSAEVTKVNNAGRLFKLLFKKRTDYILYERWGGLYLLREFGAKQVSLRYPPLATKEMFIYLHNSHSNLVPKLSAAITAMKDDGTYQTLVARHLSPLE